jgi:hypothetical protein
MSKDNVQSLRDDYDKLAKSVAETAVGTPERHRAMQAKQEAFAKWKQAADAQDAAGPQGVAVGGEPGNVAVPEGGEAGAEGEETFGEEGHTLSQLEGLTDDQLKEKPGIGDATVKRIHAARRTAARRAAK